MTERFYSPFVKYTTDTLKTLPGAKLYFYKTGTTTPQNIYQDVAQTILHTNPVVADSAGNFAAIFLNGTYTVKLTDSAGIVQTGWPVNSVGGETVSGQFDIWSPVIAYNTGALVTGSDGLRYVSIGNTNINNDPTSTSGFWAKVFFTQEWASSTSYTANQTVFLNGIEYISTQSPNLNQPPLTSPDYWQRVNNIPLWGNATAYKINDYVIDSAGNLQKALTNNTNNNPTTPSVNWKQIKEVYVWNSTLTYASGDEVWVGINRYISQQSANTNHDPVGDTGIWWKLEWQTNTALTRSLIMTGGGTLTAYHNHEFTDSSTYTLPAANTLPVGGFIAISKSDKYRAQNPIIQRAGADTISWSGANDSSITMNYGQIMTLILTSDGVSNWTL